MRKKWIGVDLDGTLASYTVAMDGAIGPPVLPMLERVREWVEQGREVRVFTARACEPSQWPAIRQWLARNGLASLAITNAKDLDMLELWDDRAIRVKRGTGYACGGCLRMKRGAV